MRANERSLHLAIRQPNQSLRLRVRLNVVAAVIAICQWQQHFQNHCQQKYFRNYRMNIT